jgi:uncharacterized protein YjgD (DUF1641 family)
MAQPIELDLPLPDARTRLQSKLESAPAEHAEAILAAYDLLQVLHDHGVLDLARGLVGSGDQVIEIAAAAAKSPQSIRGIRNLLAIAQMFGSIDPDVLETFVNSFPRILKAMQDKTKPIGFWRLAMGFLNEDFRRGIAAVDAFIETFGKSLSENEKPGVGR